MLFMFYVNLIRVINLKLTKNEIVCYGLFRKMWDNRQSMKTAHEINRNLKPRKKFRINLRKTPLGYTSPHKRKKNKQNFRLVNEISEWSIGKNHEIISLILISYSNNLTFSEKNKQGKRKEFYSIPNEITAVVTVFLSNMKENRRRKYWWKAKTPPKKRKRFSSLNLSSASFIFSPFVLTYSFSILEKTKLVFLLHLMLCKKLEFNVGIKVSVIFLKTFWIIRQIVFEIAIEQQLLKENNLLALSWHKSSFRKLEPFCCLHEWWIK